MCRLALVILALALAPPAAAATSLTVAPHDFSPKQKRLRIHAALPTPQRVGVQLATVDGRPLGWIVPPQRRRFLDLRWNGRLAGKRVKDGAYHVRLVEGIRVLASSTVRVDQTPARILDISARNRSRRPFQGDKDRFTTISPNGDKYRESAKIAFTLTEAAQMVRRSRRSSASTGSRAAAVPRAAGPSRQA